MSENELPKGWSLTTLPHLIGSDGLLTDGDWVESKDQDANGGVRLIQLADIGDGNYRDRSDRFLTLEAAVRLGCTFLKAGDLLIARMPDPLGRACIFPGDTKPSVTVVDVCIVRPGTQSVWTPWLMHFVNAPTIRRAVAELQAGTTRKRISKANLSTIPLPVPPVEEQKRIAEAVDKQFSRLDAGVEALKRVQAQLKRYRASILKAACEGRLVPTEAELARSEKRDYEPADKLLACILKERRARWEADHLAKMKASGRLPKDDKWKTKYVEPPFPDSNDLPSLPQGWCYATLEQLVNEQDGMITGPFGTLIGKSDHRAHGVPVLGIPNIDHGRFVEGAAFHLDPVKASSLGHYVVAPGDLVVSRSGTVGEICAIPPTASGALISTNLMRLRLVASVDPAWCIVNFRGSPVVASQMQALCKGSTRPFLNLGILSQLVVALPPIREQQRALVRVDELLSVEGGIQALTQSATSRAARLRQSALSAAFEGRLVPQDPADEPASKLLERISAAEPNEPWAKQDQAKRASPVLKMKATR